MDCRVTLFLAMTECVVIASLKGVAIHWSSVIGRLKIEG